MSGGTSSLERTYLRLLRAYPDAWRRRHGSDVLAVLLDRARDEGRSRPYPREVLDLLGHGLLERAGEGSRAAGGLLPREVRDLTGWLALVSGGALAAVVLGLSEVVGKQPAGWAVPTVGPFRSWGALLCVVLLAALSAACVGLPRTARALAATVAVVALVAVAIPAGVAHQVVRPPRYELGVWGVLAALAAGAPLRWSRGARWFSGAGTALLAAVLALPALGNMPNGAEGRLQFYRGAGEGTVGHVAGLVLVASLAVAVVGTFLGRRSWLPAVALVAAPWVILASIGWLGMYRVASSLAVVVSVTVAVVVLTAVAGLLAPLAGLKLTIRLERT